MPEGRALAHHAVRQATLLAGGYAILAGLYIAVSGRIADALAVSQDQLAGFESAKGFAFVGTTAAALFFASWGLFRRRDGLAATLAAQRQALAEAEGRAMAGTLASAVAHDIRNVLTVTSLAHEGLAAQPLTEDQAASLDAAQRATTRLTALASRLRDSARAGVTTPVEADLRALAQEAVDLARLHAAVRSCRVEVIAGPPVRLQIRPAEVHQIVWNLVINAGQAIGRPGRIVVEASCEGDQVRLTVHDDGPGFAEDAIPRILGGLYTTKPDGSGLGLLSVQAAARRYGGELRLLRSPVLGGGAVQVSLGRSASP